MSDQELLVRTDWSRAEVDAIYYQPFNDLLFRAHSVHRRFFDHNRVQISTLLSIKTGACPEDCKYCPQSSRYHTGLKREPLMSVETVLEKARQAKAGGSTRFCMGAAWRNPNERDLKQVVEMIKGVKELGLESCATLGMLNSHQANALSEAGLDYYNHNLDTSPEYYGEVISTRTYEDRLETLREVHNAGINVCCGGIVGMGEEAAGRIGLLHQLATLPTHPQSVPINLLVKVAGTPMADEEDLDPIDFVRCIATARILMPESHVRLSAGRMRMSDELQALCFFVGANSVHVGEKLLTTPLPEQDKDWQLFSKLGIESEVSEHTPDINEMVG
ncbi:biotin synthase BioB [Endozoicomonas sp. OPT23]|nr:biotin synthase BioB [Endozoicomonas sp. OPT23]